MKRRRLVTYEEPQINLTPLIDVVFVILIMFIVVAPLLEMQKIELASGPPLEKSTIQDKSPITIYVHEDDTITMNDLPFSVVELQKIKALFPDAHPQVYHDKKARFGTYQELKNTLESVGFREMDLILKPN